MNRPPEKYVAVREERLLTFTSACFEKAGLDAGHAALIARLLVNSDLRGVRSHGTRQTDHYCLGFEEGHLNPAPSIRVVHETPTAVVLDGDGTLDLVSACEGETRTMFVHWGPADRSRLLDAGAWKTEPLGNSAGRFRWMFSLPLQVNNAGGIDIVAGGPLLVFTRVRD